MSDYGRRWEQIRDIRESIVAMVPSARVDSVEAASEDVERHCRHLRALLADWYTLESRSEEA